ncbi:redoxin family protein [Candidatus Kaiserbacteria bacterium]|nr:redoxin family protein [Candidatus Kaiserbacteria bacterium]
MNILGKNILLGVVLVLIAGSIWYLQLGKVRPEAGVKGDVLTDAPTNPADVDSVPDVSPDGTLSAKAKEEIAASSKPSASASVATNARIMSKAEKAKKYKSAREITPGGGFINTEPFKLKDLIGKKVVLLDFWTYSCINCKRTTPYLNAWYQKYKDQGFVIVGVHTPEFDFEKVYDNVANAVKEAGIKYPVVQDNNYATWQTYENQFWPREYLIDIDGYIVHDHIGEGGYDETERLIQAALKERAQVLGTSATISSDIANPNNVITFDSGKVQSREAYFGASRNEYLGNGTQGVTGSQQLSIPSTIEANTLYLGGNWNFKNEYAENVGSGGKFTYKYNAKNVYFVASADAPVDITIMLDGKITGHQTIKENKLYTLVQGTNYGEHTLEVIINTPGLKAYTFTFG